MRYIIWNNKGGTGKTSLAFQLMASYALNNPDKTILAIDLCPQANLSELLLGGLIGNGGANLNVLYNSPKRCSVGGYFQERMLMPFDSPSIRIEDFISVPHAYNNNVPSNISLLAGDKLLEIQSVALTTLANTQLPGVNTRLSILDWINDFINATGNAFDTVFIDTNPSFSIHTQIALAASERIILPIMADDSSRRAISNVFTLIYGINVPNPIYENYTFSSTMSAAGRPLPLIHMVIRNRITQYMGEASAYGAVLNHITSDIQSLLKEFPQYFSFNNVSNNTFLVTDFGTTGVVSFAEGTPFEGLKTGQHIINGRKTKVNVNMLESCIEEIRSIVELL